VLLFIFFLLLFWVCFRLKRLLFLVRDFPTVVLELRLWPRVSNQGRNDQGFLIKGGRGVIWHTNQNQCPLKRVEFMCGEMLPNLRRRLQMVLMWRNEWCTMEILSVWFVVCDTCMEEMLYGLQVCFGCWVQWTAMFGNVESAWWGWSSKCPMVVFCMTHAMLRQQCCVVVSWQCRGLTKVASWWIPLEY